MAPQERSQTSRYGARAIGVRMSLRYFDAHPRAVFFVAVILGFAAIVVSTSSVVLKLFLITAIMTSYMGWVWHQVKAGENSEAYADSLYYLGFILTLMTLFAAVLPALLTNENPNVEYIIAQFSTGLLSTVFGLAGRIFFSQFAATSDKSLEEAQNRTARSLNTFAIEVEDNHRYLNKIRCDAAEELVRLSTDCRNAITTVGKDCAAAIEAVTKDAVDGIQASFSESRTVMLNNQNQFSNCIAKVDEEVRRLQGSLETQNQLSDEQTKAIKACGATIKEAGKQYAVLLRQAETLGDARSKLEQLRDLLGEVKNNYTAFTKDLELAKSVVVDQTETVQKYSESLRYELNLARQRREELESEVQRAQKSVQEVHRSLLDNTNFIIGKLSN
jgi:hypothetical protein